MVDVTEIEKPSYIFGNHHGYLCPSSSSCLTVFLCVRPIRCCLIVASRRSLVLFQPGIKAKWKLYTWRSTCSYWPILKSQGRTLTLCGDGRGNTTISYNYIGEFGSRQSVFPFIDNPSLPLGFPSQVCLLGVPCPFCPLHNVLCFRNTTI